MVVAHFEMLEDEIYYGDAVHRHNANQTPYRFRNALPCIHWPYPLDTKKYCFRDLINPKGSGFRTCYEDWPASLPALTRELCFAYGVRGEISRWVVLVLRDSFRVYCELLLTLLLSIAGTWCSCTVICTGITECMDIHAWSIRCAGHSISTRQHPKEPRIANKPVRFFPRRRDVSPKDSGRNELCIFNGCAFPHTIENRALHANMNSFWMLFLSMFLYC